MDEIIVRLKPRMAKSGQFRKAISYKYVIYTGSRCLGMTSNNSYKTRNRALGAGERMKTKLISIASNN